MKLVKKIAVFASAALPVLAFAQAAPSAGPDLSTLTGAVDLSTVGTAILAIAGTLALVYVAMRGAKLVLGMIRGG
jgi:hypothetical protein